MIRAVALCLALSSCAYDPAAGVIGAPGEQESGNQSSGSAHRAIP
jgi:hypothetical protein